MYFMAESLICEKGFMNDFDQRFYANKTYNFSRSIMFQVKSISIYPSNKNSTPTIYYLYLNF